MSRSPHSLLDRLHRGSGTPAQLLAGAQAVQSWVDSIAGGLRRVGFDVNDPWARLLEAPLDARSSGLQAALDHLAAAVVPPEMVAVAAHAPRAFVASAGEQPTRVPDAGAVADATRRPSGPPAGMATPQAAVRPGAPAAASTPRAAAAAWRQRAAAAGVEDAFFTPLRERNRSHAVSSVSEAQRALQAQRVQVSSRSSPRDDSAAGANFAATVAQLAALPAPVLPRLNSALDRIDQRRAAAPPERVRTVAHESRSDQGARGAGAVDVPRDSNLDFGGLNPAELWATPQRDATANAAAANADAGSTRGLRGLAARAAAAATARTGPHLPAAAAQAAGVAAPDDEQLVEQLARVLKREAERDGIDTSDVAP